MKARKRKVPRNHVAVALMQRKAGCGVHEKTEKAQRRQSKVEICRMMGSIQSVRDLDTNDGTSGTAIAPILQPPYYKIVGEWVYNIFSIGQYCSMGMMNAGSIPVCSTTKAW